MAAAREVPCFSSEYAWRPARREPHHDRSPRSSGALHACHWRHEAGQSAAVHVRLAIELLAFRIHPPAPLLTSRSILCSSRVALVKNIVGTGVLTLPAGISRLSDGGAYSSDVLGLATLLLITFGLLNGIGFLLIGEACAATSQGSYVGAWRETIGQRFSFVPALMSLFLCFVSSVACVSVIADVGTDVLAGLLGANYDAINHDAVLAAFSACVLTPLCLLPSLAPLGTASIFGVFGILVTGCAMATRLADGSYTAPGGTFVADAIAAPAFHDAVSTAGAAAHLSDLPPSTGALVFFLSLISNAYLAHYNAPGIFNECRAAELERREASEVSAINDVDPSGPLAATVSSVSGEEEGFADEAGDGEADGIDVRDSQAILLKRLTSTLAAEEVNLQFQAYIESVPSFDVSSTYRRGYADGYEAGFRAGLEVAGSVAGDLRTGPMESSRAAPAAATPAGIPVAARDVPSVQLAAGIDPALEDPSVGLEQFRRVVTGAFGASSALFLLIAWCGFATFGDAADPLILNNYASADPLAAVARLGVLLAVLFEFPLLERPFRLTALELLLPIPQFTGAITRIANGPTAAIASVGLISGIAATGVPLDALAGIAGCTGGALLIYVAPALMALRLAEESPAGAQPARVLLLRGMVALGVVLCAVGTLEELTSLAA